MSCSQESVSFLEHLCDGIEPAADTADFLLSDLVHEFEYYADGLRIDF